MSFSIFGLFNLVLYLNCLAFAGNVVVKNIKSNWEFSWYLFNSKSTQILQNSWESEKPTQFNNANLRRICHGEGVNEKIAHHPRDIDFNKSINYTWKQDNFEFFWLLSIKIKCEVWIVSSAPEAQQTIWFRSQALR